MPHHACLVVIPDFEQVAAMEEDEEEQAAAAARHRGGGMPGGGAIPAHLQGHMPSAEVAQMFQGQGHY